MPTPNAASESGAALSAPAPAALAQLVVYNLALLGNEIATSASQYYIKFCGVGLTEVRVLRGLRIEPGCLPSRLRDLSGMDKSVVSRALTSLEESGYAHREVDPDDPRRDKWWLTPVGEALVDEQIVPGVNAREQVLLQGFSEIERLTVLAILERLRNNIPGLRALANIPPPALSPAPEAALPAPVSATRAKRRRT